MLARNTRRPLTIFALLAVGLVLLGWAVISPAGGDAVTPPAEAAAPKVVEKPDAAELAARKRARLERFFAARERPTRKVAITVLGCRGEAAGGAEVSVVVGSAAVPVGQADEAGHLVARVAKGEPVTVLAEHRDQSGASAPTLADEVEVTACLGATIEGRVIDERDHPVPDVEVVLGEHDDYAVTDDEGRFVLTDLDLSAELVVATGGGGTARTRLEPLAPGEVRDLTLRIEQGRRLSGRVVQWGGAPAPYAQVSVYDDASGEKIDGVRADRFGRFWLKGVPFVPVRIGATGEAGASREITLGAQELRDDLLLLLDGRGWVACELAAELPKARSYGIFLGATMLTAVPVDGGRTRVPVPAPGSVSVYVLDEMGQRFVSCGTYEVRPGEEARATCEAPSGGARVVGRVVDGSGTPLAGTPVLLRARPGFPMVGGQPMAARDRRAATDAEGRFALEVAVDSEVSADLVARTRGLLPAFRRSLALVPGAEIDVGDLVLLSREEYAEVFKPGPFGGIGAQIAHAPDGIAFRQIVADGPLDAAGVQSGDVLLTIDGSSVANLNVSDVARTLRGEPGTTVKLLLRRGDELLRLEVEREVVDVEASGFR